MPTALILSAGSDIASANSKVLAKNGYDLLLAGRQLSELEKNAKDLEIRFGRNVKVCMGINTQRIP